MNVLESLSHSISLPEPDLLLAGRAVPSSDADFIRYDPDVDLPEPLFQSGFESLKELGTFGRIFDIFDVHKQTDIVFLKPAVIVKPNAS